MRILVTGASGFIGAALVDTLLTRGHEVRVVRRNTARLAARFPGIEVAPVDFTQAHSADDWVPWLDGIDAVVNAVGIIRKTGRQTFDSIHRLAPIALFDACEQSGVRRVVQISALGADAAAKSRYHITKRQADEFLASTRLDWVILRPSIVYGPGGQSTAFFSALAALPITPVAGDGRALLQPIASDDLIRALVHCIEQGEPVCEAIDCVGPEPLTYSQVLSHLRNWLGLGPLRALRMPYGMSKVGAVVLGMIGIAPTSAETVDMLERGNTADVNRFVKCFGFTPSAMSETLKPSQATQADRWYASLYFIPFILLASISFTWLSAGFVSAGLYPIEASLELLAPLGIAGPLAIFMLFGASLLDLLLGIAVWKRCIRAQVLLVQLATMVLYTLLISIYLPQLWLHPFGPVVKNIPLVAATLSLLAVERKWT